MSGCHIDEQERCKHGVFINDLNQTLCFACTKSDVKKLKEYVNNHEEYLKKIDKIALCDPEKVSNNEKVLSNKIEELEQKINNCDCRIHNNAHKINTNLQLNDLWTRQKHLEEKINILISNEEKKCRENNEIANRLKQLEKEINSHCKLLSEISPKLEPKKPNKCPVCEGEGINKNKLVMDREDSMPICMKNPECHACQGKGIVWG